jgi:uncharacterized protein YndB with AHSA1/START domain
MSNSSIEHATTVVERFYPATPARVFAAWADAEAQRQWNVPGNGWVIAEAVYEFRVGGRIHSLFGPPGAPMCRDEGRFEDIVENRRIVSTGSMHGGNVRTSTTLCTVELVPDGGGTRLILTDQSVFYGTGERPSDRKEGWGEILDKLAAALGR